MMNRCINCENVIKHGNELQKGGRFFCTHKCIDKFYEIEMPKGGNNEKGTTQTELFPTHTDSS